MDSSLGTTRARETLKVLRDRITSGEWPLNSKIPTEAELVEELGVGRSTVREAVRSLANLGMLEPARSRGTFVRSRTPVSGVLADFISGHDLTEVLGFRRTIEVEACRLAAANRTDDELAKLRSAHEADIAHDCSVTIERGVTPGQFHALVLKASGNSLLAEIHSGIMSGLRNFLNDGTLVHGTDEAQRHRDHGEILDAIAAQDSEAAAHAAFEHASVDLITSAQG